MKNPRIYITIGLMALAALFILNRDKEENKTSEAPETGLISAQNTPHSHQSTPRPLAENNPTQSTDEILEDKVKATEAVASYMALDDSSSMIDFLESYRMMSEFRSPEAFEAIIADVEKNGFPKMPARTLEFVNVLNKAYMTLAFNAVSDDQFDRIATIVLSDMPPMEDTHYSPAPDGTIQNLNTTTLTKYLGLTGNKKVFDVLDELFRRNPRFDIGIGMSVFWYDYSTEYYKKFYMAASDPLEPFYNLAYSRKTSLPKPDFYSVYRTWASSMITKDVSSFLKSINYDSSSLKY